MVQVASRHAAHMGEEFVASAGTTMTFYVCGHAGCGVVFAIPTSFKEVRQEDHDWWHCPNGHRWQFTGENDEERLRRELAEERRRAQSRLELLKHEERSHAATKGQLTRARKEKAALIARVANGVCPCCNRTFSQLARHMATKHPEFLDSQPEAVDAPAAAT